MAELLSPWLGKQLREHLQLGLNWLDRRRLAGRRSAADNPTLADDTAAFSDLSWNKLYKDDGRSLRIFVSRDPGKRSNVQVLKPTANPDRLNLSDGKHVVPASFSEPSLREFRQQYTGKEVVNGCLLALRDFTIIANTTEDPAGGTIKLVVEAMDWQGTANGHLIGHPKPVEEEDRLTRLVHQLQHIKARGSETDSDSDGSAAAQHYQGSGEGESTMNSQVPFATQAPNIFNPGKQKRIETVEANPLESAQPGCDHQKGSIRERKEVGREDLLSLLRRGKLPTPHQMAKDDVAGPTGLSMSTNLKSNLAQVNRGTTELVKPAVSGTPLKGSKMANKAQEDDSETASDLPQVRTRQEEQPKGDNENDYHTPGCDWMSGLRLSRAALTIPADQRALLSSDESWIPSLPGKQFPRANIPIKMLTRLNDLTDRHSTYNQTLEVDSDEIAEVASVESEASSSDSEIPQESEHRPSSVVSWSASPTPEPPQRSQRIDMDLPPDSSLPEVSDTPDVPRHLGQSLAQASRIMQLPKTPRKQMNARISTKPRRESNGNLGINGDQVLGESAKPAALTVSADIAANSSPMAKSTTSVGAPPHSLSRPRFLSQSDDDLEMLVPHGLGEDCDFEQAKSSLESKQTYSDSVPSRISQSEATILVKETPKVKDKGPGALTIIAPSSSSKQASSGGSRETCSTYVVHSTYDDLRTASGGAARTGASEVQAPDQGQEQPTPMQTRSSRPPSRSTALDLSSSSLAQKGKPAAEKPSLWTGRMPSPSPSPSQSQSPPAQVTGNSSRDHVAAHVPIHSPPLVPSEDTSSTLPAAKRKLSASPSKDKSHRTKRRVLKTIDLQFSQEPVLSQDPSTAARLQKRKWLQSYRQSSVDRSVERSIEIAVPTSTATVPLPVSPDMRQASEPGVVQPVYISHSEVEIEKQPVQELPSLVEAPIIGSRAKHSPVIDKRTDFVDLTRDSRAVLPSAESNRPSGALHTLSVFSKFKTEYPAYTGDSKHFLRMCMTALELEKEDKMVPKWQWDDYIARNETDYPRYAEQCRSEGTKPVPYHRYYKDHTRGTVFEKGVVASTATLEKAIDELSTRSVPIISGSNSTLVPARRRLVSPSGNSPSKKRTRLSLPWAQGAQTSDPPLELNKSVQPRQSLPPSRHAEKTGRGLRQPNFPDPESNMRNNVRITAQLKSASDTRSLSQNADDGEDKCLGSDGKLTQFAFNFERLTCFTGETTKASDRMLIMRPPRNPIDAFQWRLTGSDDI